MSSRMGSGELQMVREYLGLTGDQFAGMLGVNPRTLRSWEQGRDPIPERVREEVESIEATTASAVGEVVDALNSVVDDGDDPAVLVYREDASMHAARPAFSHMSARWWRHVVARAVQEVPGVEIVTHEDAHAELPHIGAVAIYVGPGLPTR